MKNWFMIQLNRVDHNKCAFLTILLIVFLLLNSFFSNHQNWDNLLWCLFYLSMIFSPWFVSPGRKMLFFSILTGLIFLLIRTAVFVSPSEWIGFWINIQTSNLSMILLILVECVLTGIVLFYTLSPRAVSREPVWGCVLAYLLVAIVFCDIYWILSRNLPDAFASNGKIYLPEMNDLLYFSFTTLTTCGYGDIAPVHPFVRQIACFEGVAGVLYIALFIGRQLKLNPKKPDEP